MAVKLYLGCLLAAIYRTPIGNGAKRMNSILLERAGGASIILGSLLLAAYAALFPALLPIGSGTYDFVQVVQDPDWTSLAAAAFAGVLLMLAGFYAVYARIRGRSDLAGAIGFLLIEAAYLLQACKITWELCLYPIIAAHPESAFLLRDGIIKHDPGVALFRLAASATILVGILLFCRLLYRSGDYPKAAAVLIFAGALVYAVGPMVSIFTSVGGIFALAAGCLLLGMELVRPCRA